MRADAAWRSAERRQFSFDLNRRQRWGRCSRGRGGRMPASPRRSRDLRWEVQPGRWIECPRRRDTMGQCGPSSRCSVSETAWDSAGRDWLRFQALLPRGDVGEWAMAGSSIRAFLADSSVHGLHGNRCARAFQDHPMHGPLRPGGRGRSDPARVALECRCLGCRRRFGARRHRREKR